MDTGAARIRLRRWVLAAGGGLALTVLTAGSTRLSDFAPYAALPALRPGDTEAIPVLQPPMTGVRHADYRLFDPRKRQDELAHRVRAIASICLTGQDGTARRLVVCAVRNPAPQLAAAVKTARIGRIR